MFDDDFRLAAYYVLLSRSIISEAPGHKGSQLGNSEHQITNTKNLLRKNTGR